MHQLFIGLYTISRGRPLLPLVISIGLCALAGWAVFQIDFDEDITRIMPADDDVMSINQVFDQTDLADKLVLLIHYEDTATEGREALKAMAIDVVKTLPQVVDTSLIDEFLHRVNQTEYVKAYQFITDHLPIFLDSSDYLLLDQNTDPEHIDEAIFGIYKSLMTPGGAFVKDFVFRDPLNFTEVVREDILQYRVGDDLDIDDGYIASGNNILMFLNPSIKGEETGRNTKLIAQLDELASKVEHRHPGVTLSYYGGTAVAVANAKQIKIDVFTTVTVALIILLLLILSYFRRFHYFLLLIIPSLFAALLSLGLLYLFRGRVSIISIGLGSVFLGITLDYALHFFTHLQQGSNKIKTLKSLTMPLLISSLTTGAAFLSLYFIRSEALKDLGIFAALSVFLSSLIALVLLPHLLPDQLPQKSTFIKSAFDRIVNFKTKLTGVWMALLAVLTLVGLFNFTDVEFEDDLYEMNYLPGELAQVEEKLNQISNTARSGTYLMTGGSNLDVSIGRTKRLHSILDSLKRAGQISDFTSPATLLPGPQEQAQKIQQWNAFWTDEKRDQVIAAIGNSSQRNGFKVGAFDDFIALLDRQYEVLPYDQFRLLLNTVLSEYTTNRQGHFNFLSIVRTHAGNPIQLYELFSKEANVNILDQSYMVSRFIQILQHDFTQLVLWTSLLVFFILHTTFGRVELALITMIPIGLSWIFSLSVMYFLGLKLNIINVIFTSFIFGLGVDYSIFISRGLIRKYQTGEDHLPAFKTSILLSVITTVVGIGVLIIAKHPALQSIAAVSVIGILSAVSMAFFLQPVLFHWLIYDRTGSPRRRPLTLPHMLYSIGHWIFFLLSGIVLLMTLPVSLLFKNFGRYLTYTLSKIYSTLFLSVDGCVALRTQIAHLPAPVISLDRVNLVGLLIVLSVHPKILIISHDSPLLRRYGLLKWLLASSGKLVDEKEAQVESLSTRGWIPVFISSSDHQNTGIEHIQVKIRGSGMVSQPVDHWFSPHPVVMEMGEWNSGHKAVEGTSGISETDYHKVKLYDHYKYKNRNLWYYLHVKLRLEDYYSIFHKIVPRSASVIDIGCGYGMMSYMLAFCSKDRRILGLDYDEEKIDTAQNHPGREGRVRFAHCDIATWKAESADTYILADVLHYLKEADQWSLLNRIHAQLRTGGQIIIRDGDRDVVDKHKNTRWTERFSTGLGFNKADNQLKFISFKQLFHWAKQHDLKPEIIEVSSRTSNKIVLLKKE